MLFTYLSVFIRHLDLLFGVLSYDLDNLCYFMMVQLKISLIE